MDEKMKTEVVPVINPLASGALSGRSDPVAAVTGDASRRSNPVQEGAEKSSRWSSGPSSAGPGMQVKTAEGSQDRGACVRFGMKWNEEEPLMTISFEIPLRD